MSEQAILYIAFIIAGVMITATAIRLWKQKSSARESPSITSDRLVPAEPVLPPSVQTLEEHFKWLKPKGSK